MKVLISADMEGTAGVVDPVQTAIPDRGAHYGIQNNAAEYDWAGRLMIEEVNAAVRGALQGGATEVWVAEAHGSMRNLLPEALHREARYVSGSPKLHCMLEGIDATFGAVLCTCYHGRAGTPTSLLAHMFTPRRLAGPSRKVPPRRCVAPPPLCLACFVPQVPIRLEIEMVNPHLADLASLIPSIARTGPRTVAWEAGDMLTSFRTWRAMLNVMMTRVAV
jgi:D-aminopeptidase